jgi:hypothetical protein
VAAWYGATGLNAPAFSVLRVQQIPVSPNDEKNASLSTVITLFSQNFESFCLSWPDW